MCTTDVVFNITREAAGHVETGTPFFQPFYLLLSYSFSLAVNIERDVTDQPVCIKTLIITSGGATCAKEVSSSVTSV